MKDMDKVPDRPFEDAELDPDDTKKFFDAYYRNRVEKAANGLLDFLIRQQGLKSTTRRAGTFQGTWIEYETPRPNTAEATVDFSLLKQIALVYVKLVEEPEHLSDRLTDLALALNDGWRIDQAQVFLYKLTMLIHQDKTPPEINEPNMITWGKFTYHIRQTVSLVRNASGTEKARSYVRGLRATVQSQMRDLVQARQPSKEDRMRRTEAVEDILRKRTTLRSADRHRIAVLVGVHFRDEKLPRSEEGFTSRLKRRKERRNRTA